MKYKTISNLDRLRIISKYNNGENFIAFAEILNIPKYTVYAIIRKYKKYNQTIKGKSRGRKVKLNGEMEDLMLNLIKDQPTLTLWQIKSKCAQINPLFLNVSTQSIHNHLKSRKVSLKICQKVTTAWNSDSTKLQRKQFVDWYNTNS